MYQILHAASKDTRACSKGFPALCENHASAPSTLIFSHFEVLRNQTFFLTAHAVQDSIIDGTKKIAPANIVLFLLVPGGCTSQLSH